MSREGSVSECPFCRAAVPEPLVVHGGTCPRCFGKIPGEEAPTDPGAPPAPARPTRAARQAARTAILSFAGGTVVLGALAFALWPRQAPTLDFDAIDYPMPDIVAAPASVRAALPPAPTGAPPIGTPAVATPEAAEPASPQPGAPAPEAPQAAPSLDLSIGAPQARRRDVQVLTDSGAIRRMIGEHMLRYVPGLQECYDLRLKEMPNLEGRWRLTFTVDPSGAVVDAEVEGVDTSDAALEACLADHVTRRWTFSKVAVAQPVTRTLRFDRR